jgi:hypothetical protein
MSVCDQYIKKTGTSIDDVKKNLYQDGNQCITNNLSYCKDECSTVNRNQKACWRCLTNPISCPTAESKCRSTQVDCSKNPRNVCCTTPCCPHVELAVECSRLMNKNDQNIKEAIKSKSLSKTEVIIISVCSVVGVIILIIIVVVVIRVNKSYKSKQSLINELKIQGKYNIANNLNEIDVSSVDPNVLSKVQKRLENEIINNNNNNNNINSNNGNTMTELQLE